MDMIFLIFEELDELYKMYSADYYCELEMGQRINFWYTYWYSIMLNFS